ncbi:uncharacterized protein LOC121983035 [Zingiber officinale]|uniref:Uncharacterized protein n=1 Tax=Zingiber officinale TaxID=94328 RepID=A0A8J5LBF8_ZINOF|nr:uncharacterized protein LOC121983035 [Zingiber officinale]KAG6507457.1 hypothetical protein ZIOFF_032801 [Zingiber officinale]
MSVGEKDLEAAAAAAVPASGDDDAASAAGRRRRDGSSVYERCVSGLEFALEAGRPLRELDPEKIKEEIKRWAKAVVAYARQLSFGSKQQRSEN